MKNSDLKTGDIIVVDHSWCPTGVIDSTRPIVSYVVMENYNGCKVAVAFNGDCNCGSRPMGWYNLESPDLPLDTIGVFRAKHLTHTFNGDYNNSDIYECIYKAL